MMFIFSHSAMYYYDLDQRRRLTDIELKLFRRGAEAAASYDHWRKHGRRPIPVSKAILATKVFEPVRVVSPDPIEKTDGSENKRIRVN